MSEEKTTLSWKYIVMRGFDKDLDFMKKVFSSPDKYVFTDLNEAAYEELKKKYLEASND